MSQLLEMLANSSHGLNVLCADLNEVDLYSGGEKRSSTLSSIFEQSGNLLIGGVYNHTTFTEQRTSRQNLGNVVRIIGKTGSVKGVLAPMGGTRRMSWLALFPHLQFSYEIPREAIRKVEDHDLHAGASMDQPPFDVVIPPTGPGAEVPEVIDPLDDGEDDELVEIERPPPPTLRVH
ncbi:hypothetical protein PQX77_015213 [Marasmius sp. AFHP31]|nr:hypothetical protein PQX77_015213 [Marasmius sp. AFHP31]